MSSVVDVAGMFRDYEMPGGGVLPKKVINDRMTKLLESDDKNMQVEENKSMKEVTRFKVGDKCFDVDCENKESREKFEKYLRENLPQYSLWKEKSGNENWVLYRNDMFEVCDDMFLHYKGEKEIELPVNCSSCLCMFWNCKLPKEFSLGDKFDTSNVTNMHHMFFVCSLPKGFSLGDKFDTRNVKDMSYMFHLCSLPKGFSLGDKFDTRNVKDMSYMFWYCELPKGFSFGKNFIISDNTDTFNMFDLCTIPEGVVLPKIPSEETAQSATGF